MYRKEITGDHHHHPHSTALCKTKIYFAGSVTGGRDDVAVYSRIVEELRKHGEVMNDFLAKADLGKMDVGLDDKTIHDRQIEWLQECDVVVAECTQTSQGVGYELGRAVALGKRILIIFRPDSGKKLSPMLRGADNGTSFICKDYRGDEFVQILTDFFKS